MVKAVGIPDRHHSDLSSRPERARMMGELGQYTFRATAMQSAVPTGRTHDHSYELRQPPPLANFLRIRGRPHMTA